MFLPLTDRFYSFVKIAILNFICLHYYLLKCVLFIKSNKLSKLSKLTYMVIFFCCTDTISPRAFSTKTTLLHRYLHTACHSVWLVLNWRSCVICFTLASEKNTNITWYTLKRRTVVARPNIVFMKCNPYLGIFPNLKTWRLVEQFLNFLQLVFDTQVCCTEILYAAWL